jgi:hypothetical protein
MTSYYIPCQIFFFKLFDPIFCIWCGEPFKGLQKKDKKEEKNTKNSDVPKLLHWSCDLRQYLPDFDSCTKNNFFNFVLTH